MVSETDTEVAAHLLAAGQAGAPLGDAMRTVADGWRRLHPGRPDADVPGVVVAARRNSPLVVGVGEGENFVASDVAAFIEYTREAIELGQDQVVTITPDDVVVTDFDGAAGRGPALQVDWDLSAAEKGGFDWFMRKEIYEQPQAVADTLLGRYDANGRLNLDELRIAEAELRTDRQDRHRGLRNRVLRRHGGQVRDRALDPDPCEVELATSSATATRSSPTTLVVAISQSGETADTLMAIRHAREQGARVLAICNTNGSTIPRESDAVIYTHAGPEIGVASTKGFLTQLAACYLLGLYLAQVRGNKFGDEIGPRCASCSRCRRPSRCWTTSSR